MSSSRLSTWKWSSASVREHGAVGSLLSDLFQTFLYSTACGSHFELFTANPLALYNSVVLGVDILPVTTYSGSVKLCRMIGSCEPTAIVKLAMM